MPTAQGDNMKNGYGMLNANMVSTINTLKMKAPNRVFHEWCNTVVRHIR